MRGSGMNKLSVCSNYESVNPRSDVNQSMRRSDRNEKRMKIMTEKVSNNQCSVSFTRRRDLSFLAIQTLNIVHCSWSDKIKDHVRRQRRTRVADLDEEGVGPSAGVRER